MFRLIPNMFGGFDVFPMGAGYELLGGGGAILAISLLFASIIGAVAADISVFWGAVFFILIGFLAILCGNGHGTFPFVSCVAPMCFYYGLISICSGIYNNFVDGVPRSMMHLVCAPSMYGKIRTYLDKVQEPGVGTQQEEFYSFHGVRTYSCVHLPDGVEAILMVTGAVAQPVMSNVYTAEKIPLSNAYGIELFYSYGTKAVTPDLIFVYKSTTSSGE